MYACTASRLLFVEGFQVEHKALQRDTEVGRELREVELPAGRSFLCGAWGVGGWLGQTRSAAARRTGRAAAARGEAACACGVLHVCGLVSGRGHSRRTVERPAMCMCVLKGEAAASGKHPFPSACTPDAHAHRVASRLPPQYSQWYWLAPTSSSGKRDAAWGGGSACDAQLSRPASKGGRSYANSQTP